MDKAVNMKSPKMKLINKIAIGLGVAVMFALILLSCLLINIYNIGIKHIILSFIISLVCLFLVLLLINATNKPFKKTYLKRDNCYDTHFKQSGISKYSTLSLSNPFYNNLYSNED
ncbi:hypothetical protein ACMCDV_000761 [Campylobacter jejuni]|uniref:hypothetical protein n=1 Tax=Campylobacter jejuni TaxID=197 RepID=UPI0015BEC0D5|nr:hypothetical protein [Campylobacter jejuni]NWL53898.1 hypothetical protein [Campylobacter jejuni subsp. jejuni]HEC2864876.1 hypothetical protein [Campylobacter jejuni]HED9856174.1 hypothetical protein [Campylobacter jejuni]HEF6370848.1 hypothetical protein [Campylobacter jejuni]